MQKSILWILFLTLFGSSTAYADRIVLIYGDILEGEVVSETDATITFRGDFGERTLMRSDIREIQTDASSQPPAAVPQTAPVTQPQVAPVQQTQPQPALTTNPTPYDILKQNVEMQSKWRDLEIAYLQRSYIGGQTIQTQYIARIIPPDYLRANLTTPIPSTPQVPEGGEVEYDMYRARTKLFQVVKMPSQPVQYLKLDLARIDGINPGDNPVEAFKKGFAGAGTNDNLLQAIARNSALIGTENTDGHDCWVIETVNTPDLVEAQVASQPADIRERLRQELSSLGRIRSWVGREDLIQWRMENYSREGNLLLSMKMVTVKPNQNLSAEQLRMKVPKGTASAFVDVTDMVAGQFNEVINGSPGMVPIPSVDQLQNGGPGLPYQSTNPNQVWPGQSSVRPQQLQVPAIAPQSIPQTYTSAQPMSPQGQIPQMQSQVGYAQPQRVQQRVPQQQMIPQQQMPMQRQVVYQQPAPQAYQQSYPPQSPYGQGFTQSYVVGGPQGMTPQAQGPMPQMMQQMPQQQQPRRGGFLQRLFGGGGSRNQQSPMPMGMSPGGNQTMMMPVINGQPQFPSQ